MPPRRFWIVKANRRFPIPGRDERYGDLDAILSQKSPAPWLTYKHIDELCQRGDGIFFWRSSPKCDVRGIGIFERIHSYRNPENRFDVRYVLNGPIPNPVQLRSIRQVFQNHPLLAAPERSASFLKPSVVQTIYPLNGNQARVIATLLISENANDRHPLAVSTCEYLREWFPAVRPTGMGKSGAAGL